MAVLDILVYPDPRLRRQAAPVARVDDPIRRLVDDMAETMYAAPGVGLAAVQVDVLKQIIVIDISETRNELKVFINPTIVASPRRGRNRGGLSVGARRVCARHARGIDPGSGTGSRRRMRRA